MDSLIYYTGACVLMLLASAVIVAFLILLLWGIPVAYRRVRNLVGLYMLARHGVTEDDVRAIRIACASIRTVNGVTDEQLRIILNRFHKAYWEWSKRDKKLKEPPQ